MILDAISAPFSIPFRAFGHHFGILFRYRFFDDFWMPFRTTFDPKSKSRAGIWSITFSNFFLVFSGPRSRDGFWMDFDGFWLDFGWIFMNFGPILEHRASFFRSFWIRLIQLLVISSFSAAPIV